jgi:hypothetical protein
MVVLPTPGPPVMTSTLDINASRIARTKSGAASDPNRQALRQPGNAPL